MKISACLEALKTKDICRKGDTTLSPSALVWDNRKIVPDCIFIGIKGAKFDTHACLEEAWRGGAAMIVAAKEDAFHPDLLKKMEASGDTRTTLVLAEDTRLAKALLLGAWYGHPEQKMTIVGVTGSKGKTTTTHMIAHILQEAGHKTGTIGTNGAIYEDVQYDLSNSTPDSEEIYAYLDEMARHGCTHVVLECSSQGLMQYRVGGIPFAWGVFTNIVEGDHVGPNEHRDFNEYLHMKARLLENSQKVLVNGDDPHLPALLEKVTAPVLTFAIEKEGDYRAAQIEKIYIAKHPHVRFRVTGKLEDVFKVNLPGDFTVDNALAAIALCHEMGIETVYMKKALLHIHIKGRLDMVYQSKAFSVCVDFAHNGQSTRNLLKALREYRPGRVVCVFGADGNRAKSRRYEMGEASGALADLSIITSGHNRLESFEDIARDIHVGLDKTGGAFLEIKNRKEAIRYAIEKAREGDLIAIIGLGHENFQDEGGVKYPYSDTEYVQSLLREKGLL